MEERQAAPAECETGETAKQIKSNTLLELSIGIILWGVLSQITLVWFVEDKSGYSMGLWIGTALALLAGFHMWWALDRALDCAQDAASKMIVKQSIIRYLVIVVALAAVMMSGFLNPLATFLGLMGLKVSAYLQPFTYKICSKFYKKIS